MCRLLTGYAVSYNFRHRRHGHLFQNCCKSILCQENSYLLELVRYIHLNPLRAIIVKDLRGLNGYPYCGYSCILGKRLNTWQDKDYILKLFASNKAVAVRRYRNFVKKVLAQAKENFERKYHLKANGFNLEKVIGRVAQLLSGNIKRQLRLAVCSVSGQQVSWK